MIDTIKKIIIVVAIAAIGYSGYKSYEIRDFLKAGAVQIADQATLNHGVILPIPFGPTYLFDIDLKTKTEPPSQIHVDRIVLHRWVNNDDRAEGRVSFAGVDETQFVYPPEAIAATREFINDITGRNPVSEFLFSPIIEMIAPTQGLLPAGFRKITDGQMGFTLDKKTKQLNFSQSTERQDLGALTLSATLSVMDTNAWSPTQIPLATLVDAHVTYEDNGLMQHYTQYHAQRIKTTPDAWRNNLKEQLQQDLAKEKIKLWPDVINSINKYLDKPSYIRFQLAPEKPVPLRDFQHYRGADLPALVNLSVSLEAE